MDISKILKDTQYQEMADHILDNVINYDLNNNYFKIKKGDPKTIMYVMEAAKQLGHIGGSMNSYGHAKYLLATGRLPLSKDADTGRYMVDLQKADFEIINEAFDGKAYVELIKEGLEAKHKASEQVLKVIQSQYMKGNFDVNNNIYTSLNEAYIQIVKDSQIPSHHFKVENNNLKFQAKNYSVAEDLNAQLKEGILNESQAGQYFKKAQDQDEKFFDTCNSITRQLVKLVELVATKLAADNQDSLQLETLEYEFVNQADIVKEFFASQYGENNALLKILKEHYEVKSTEELLQKFNM